MLNCTVVRGYRECKFTNYQVEATDMTDYIFCLDRRTRPYWAITCVMHYMLAVEVVIQQYMFINNINSSSSISSDVSFIMDMISLISIPYNISYIRHLYLL